MATMSATYKQVTPMEILANRKARKDAGMVGCIGRKPVTGMDFYGYRDVQCWNIDVKGRFPDQEGYDYTNPNCFCFDCRGAFDSSGTIDAELVNAKNPRALFVYGILENKAPMQDVPEAEKEDEEDKEEDEGEEYAEEDDVEGVCQDCTKELATDRFLHLDGRSFNLCAACFCNADHEDFYLAQVEPPRLRPNRRAAYERELAAMEQGLSNVTPPQAEQKMPQVILLPRTNGGGIEAP